MAEEEKPLEPRLQDQRPRKQRRQQENGEPQTISPDEASEESEAGLAEKTSEPVAATHVAARESKAVPVLEKRPAQAKDKHEAGASSEPKVTGHAALLRFRRRRKR